MGTAQQKKTVVDHNAVWKKHNAEVHDVKTVRHTFHVSVTCPTWQDMEALRANLVSDRLVVSLQDNRKAKLVNKRIPQLVNMRRIFGNNPIVHVYNIDTDYENYHSKFMQNFDWDREYSVRANRPSRSISCHERLLHGPVCKTLSA